MTRMTRDTDRRARRSGAMTVGRRIAGLTALVLAGALTLSGCGGSSASSASGGASASSGSSSSSASSGFEEYPVGPHQDQNVGPLLVGAVYFQPVDMEPASMGLKAADASFHLEADIHANAKGTKLGYGKGDFVPDLTVNYDIVDTTTNTSVGSGTFMQMNASDGPHYGANIKLDDAGSYKLVLSIDSPEKKGWMLHVDPETGVTGRFWTSPLKVTFTDWDYTPRQW